MKWLSEPLMHEGEDRTEAEATVLELALNLIRYAVMSSAQLLLFSFKLTGKSAAGICL